MFNYVAVEFPLAQNAPKRVSSFTLIQNRYAHEFVIINFKDWNVQYNDIKPTQPVKCILRGRDSAREFVGYIHDIKPSISPGNRSVSVTLIGASYKLKQARQRVFKNVTADQVVQQIASEYGFIAYTEPHPRVYEQIAQAGITDLQLMARLARQCGYTLRLENTTIYFQSLTTDYKKFRSTAQTYEMRDANDPKGSSLYSFNLTLGESMQYMDAYKSAAQVGGVYPAPTVVNGSPVMNLVTNQVRPNTIRQDSNTELFDSFATETVAPSYQIAYYEAQAIDENNRFPYRATVKVFGTPNVRPDKPVFITGLGIEYSGYWIVLSARHEINETSPNIMTYNTILEIGTDSLGQAQVFDNQAVFTPDELSTRQLDGTRSVPSTGSSIVSVSGINNNSNIGFPETNNRTQPTVVSSAKAFIWKASNSAEVASTTDVRNRSAVVLQKLEANSVL